MAPIEFTDGYCGFCNGSLASLILRGSFHFYINGSWGDGGGGRRFAINTRF
jgi:hypothetical protein